MFVPVRVGVCLCATYLFVSVSSPLSVLLPDMFRGHTVRSRDTVKADIGSVELPSHLPPHDAFTMHPFQGFKSMCKAYFAHGL